MMRAFSARSRRIRRAGPRRGFSLIEIMISVTLLGIIMMSLGQLTIVVSSRGRTNDLIAKRNTALQREADKFRAMPYDSLGTFSTADRVLAFGGWNYTRRLTITTVGTTRREVKIVIIPTSDATAKDSVTLHRAKGATTALCSTC
jgi:prepilin-type N-terminal cleavage/methylation domain-containing protein